jgi:hypothetical protein
MPCGARYKQCCDAEVIVDSVESQPTGAGVCLVVEGLEWQYFDATTNSLQTAANTPNGNGRSVLQLRDKAILEGDIALDPNGNPGAVLTRTYTNPFPCPALLEVDLYVSDNYTTDVYGNDEAITMVHKIGTVLNEPLPQATNTEVDRTVITNTVSDSGMNVGNNMPLGGGGFSAQTAYGGQYQQILSAGQSVTVIAQSWLMLFEHKNSISGNFTVHANKSMKGRITRGGILV